MEELPPVQESAPDAPHRPAMSFAARLLNVFAVPGEVFEGVKTNRISIANWLVPALLLAAVGMVSVTVAVSQPALHEQLRESSGKLAKVLQQQVNEGKLEQADADSALVAWRALTDPVTLRTMGAAAVAVFNVGRVFWWALLLWLLARAFLRVRVDYLKALEVSGLGLMISVLGGVVTLLLMVNLPKLFATTDLVLAASNFDPRGANHLLLGVANLFSLWLVGVLSVGLARLTGVPFIRAAWLVFAAWVIQESFLVLVGGVLGQFAL
jgi:hypothetical protein